MHVIAVDAMGGDNAPQAIVEGVNQALAEFKSSFMVTKLKSKTI